MADLLGDNDLLIKFLDNIKDLPNDLNESMENIRDLDDKAQPLLNELNEYYNNKFIKLSELLNENIDIADDQSKSITYRKKKIKNIMNGINELSNNSKNELNNKYNKLLELTSYKIECGKGLYQKVDTHIRRLDTQLKKLETSLRRDRMIAPAEAINLRDKPFEPPSEWLPMLLTISAAASSSNNNNNNNNSNNNIQNNDMTDKEKLETAAKIENPPLHPDEPIYCICKQQSHGTMICCDNEDDCEMEWFHLECVGLKGKGKPKGTWYCPQCREKLRKTLGPKAFQKKRKRKRSGRY